VFGGSLKPISRREVGLSLQGRIYGVAKREIPNSAQAKVSSLYELIKVYSKKRAFKLNPTFLNYFP
jgi:hypothetical protein